MWNDLTGIILENIFMEDVSAPGQNPPTQQNQNPPDDPEKTANSLTLEDDDDQNNQQQQSPQPQSDGSDLSMGDDEPADDTPPDQNPSTPQQPESQQQDAGSDLSMGDDNDTEGGAGDDMSDGNDEGGSQDDDTGSSTNNEPDPYQQLRDLEQSIFDQLSATQKENKIRELKELYRKTYEKCDTISDAINKIDSGSGTTKIYTFIQDTLEKLKVMIHDYYSHSFDDSTYLQNMVQYKKYLAIFSSIDNTLDELQKQDD